MFMYAQWKSDTGRILYYLCKQNGDPDGGVWFIDVGRGARDFSVRAPAESGKKTKKNKNIMHGVA